MGVSRRAAFRGLTALVLIIAGASPCAHAFIPGTLPADEAADLREGGFEGVPATRAFRLPDLTSTDEPVTMNILVLLVEFSDIRADRENNPPAAIYRRLFESGGETPSLRDYYRENSGGRLELRGQVTRWVRVDSTMAFYAGESGGISTSAYPRNAQRLVEEAIAKIADEIDPREFDNNGDGLIDGLLVIHAGAGVDETSPLSNPDNRRRILAHQFHTRAEVPFGSLRAFDYAITDEALRPGVVAHEFGHLLGLIDLYDTGFLIGVSGPFGVGDWSLMGTGALLDNGRSPANLDAWSRQRLGFIDVTRLDATDGTTVVTLRAASNEALRLWGATGETEYFLLEARMKTGLDAFLPGEGVVIYHVDELVQTNSGSSRYRVAVVQADGRNDLGRQGGNRGDVTDAYPSAFPVNDDLTENTVPSSHSNSGSPSNVRVGNIRPGGGGFTMDVTVSAVPRPVVTNVTVREIEGNGDGFFTAGERGSMDITLENRGRSITHDNLSLGVAPTEPYFSMERPILQVGTLGLSEVRHISDAFSFRAGTTPIPPAIYFHTIFAFSECVPCPPFVQPDSVLVALGSPAGLTESFDPPSGNWTAESFSSLTSVTWHLSNTRFQSPPSAFFIGLENGSPYPPRLDAVLTSPPFRIPPGGQLSFRHRVDAESLATGRAWDGGFIEISVSGGAWTTLEPPGGYPFLIETGSGNPLYDRGVFSGSSRGFRREAFDLAPLAGKGARIRFRFGSDAFTVPVAEQTQTGWVIDDVAIEPAPVRVALSASVTEDNAVMVSGTLSGSQSAAAIEIRRRADAPEARAVVLETVNAPGTSFQISDEPAAGRYIYEARVLLPDGPGLTFAADAVDITGTGGRPRLEVPFPTPYHRSGPPITLEYVLPPAAAGRSFHLDVFDVQGRQVARLAEGIAEPGTYRTWWIGVSASGELRGGLYWARLTTDGFGDSVRRIVVVP